MLFLNNKNNLFLLLFFICLLIPHHIIAQDTACDPEYFKSLKSRAWLEAQREITQNQNLIFKPDSVFEYTCFDRYLNELADHAKDMFSETQRWGDIPGIDQEKGMDKALQSLVGTALETYIKQNFQDGGDKDKYALLGGRLESRGQKTDAAGNVIQQPRQKVDYEVKKIDGSGNRKDYECNMMDVVWMQAKCMDFIDNVDHDGFFTFEEYERHQKDHRFLPKECEHVGRWDPEIKAAYINGEPTNGTPWKEDPIKIYHDLLKNEKCGDTDPVATGLKVKGTGGANDEEKVCIPPGCYYQGGSCTP